MHTTELNSTGWDFLDRILGGGHSPGKVYGILSPTGCGRSTLAIMLAAKGAAIEAAKCVSGSEAKPGVWMLFSLGQSTWDSLRQAIAALAGGVPRNFSNEDRELRSSDPAWTKRMAIAISVVERHIVVPDRRLNIVCQSWTLVDALSKVIEHQTNNGRRIAGIVIDDAKYLIDPRILDYKDRARLLRQLPLECRMYVAERWHCPVWLSHPIAGARSSGRWTAPLKHEYASECRKFADYLDACCVIGPKDELGRRFRLAVTKGSPCDSEPLTMVFAEGGAIIREVGTGEFSDRTVKTRPFVAVSPAALQVVRDIRAQQHALVASADEQCYVHVSVEAPPQRIYVDLTYGGCSLAEADDSTYLQNWDGSPIESVES